VPNFSPAFRVEQQLWQAEKVSLADGFRFSRLAPHIRIKPSSYHVATFNRNSEHSGYVPDAPTSRNQVTEFCSLNIFNSNFGI